MRKLILGLLLLAMVGCSTNITPALIATNELEKITIGSIDTVDNLITNSIGLSQEKKDQILAFSKVQRENFLLLMTELREYIQSTGSIDWDELAEKAFELYLKLKDK